MLTSVSIDKSEGGIMRASRLLAIIPVTVLLTGCGGSTSKDTAAPPGPSAPPAAASLSASPPGADNLTGPPGKAFTMPASLHAGGTYEVAMVRVVQHAALAAGRTLTTPGDHVAAAEFVIKGKTGPVNEDADNYATVIGSDGQYYTFTPNTITEGTNFSSGTFAVSPGLSVTGWVAFELPAGVRIASVQWVPGGAPAATWQA